MGNMSVTKVLKPILPPPYATNRMPLSEAKVVVVRKRNDKALK